MVNTQVTIVISNGDWSFPATVVFDHEVPDAPEALVELIAEFTEALHETDLSITIG